MELNKSIVASLANKCILVTGATGFLAKLFVEKILRIQPNVKKLFLLLRAADAASASRRLHDEVIPKGVFRVIKETYDGDKFSLFMSDKLIPVAGDTALENLGIGDANTREKIFTDVDVVVNFAATTNFHERYDVALYTNTLGPKNILNFCKKCVKLELLLHVSTAYVCGEKSGLILEEPCKMGETLYKTTAVLDIEVERKVIEQRLEELKAKQISKKEETKAMKELGLQRARLFGWPNVYVFTKAMGEMVIGEWRESLPVVIIRPTIVTSTIKEPFPGWVEGVKTVDSFFAGFGQGKITTFLGNSKTIMDVIPGDMVVNAAIVAIVSHGGAPNSKSMIIYQVGSSNKGPMYSLKLCDYAYNYFSKNPLMSEYGKSVKVVRPYRLSSMDSLHIYLDLKYNLPLKGLRLMYAMLCHDDGGFCNTKLRQVKILTQLAKFNEPYLLFKGSFDDSNTEKLRIAVKANEKEENMFYFDPKCINWDDYFMNVHLPGLMKYVLSK